LTRPSQALRCEREAERFIDATGAKKLRSFLTDSDVEGDKRPSVVPEGLTKWLALPSEISDLFKPVLFRNACVFRDAVEKSVVHQRGYKLIARTTPGDGTLMPVETEARNLPDHWTHGHRAGTEMRIKAIQQMGSVGSKKAGRGAVPNAIFEQNEIFGIRIIELINFEFLGKNGQIPFQ
jgi:hypothetical protein